MDIAFEGSYITRKIVCMCNKNFEESFICHNVVNQLEVDFEYINVDSFSYTKIRNHIREINAKYLPKQFYPIIVNNMEDVHQTIPTSKNWWLHHGARVEQ